MVCLVVFRQGSRLFHRRMSLQRRQKTRLHHMVIHMIDLRPLTRDAKRLGLVHAEAVVHQTLRYLAVALALVVASLRQQSW